jgi:Fe-S-cluster-containing dehydrogenase component
MEYRVVPGKKSTTAFKCDGCVDRRAASRKPACVEACVTGALIFGDLNGIVAARRTRRSVNLTRELSGYAPQEIPANIAAFRRVQEKIAQFGILPSGKEE